MKNLKYIYCSVWIVLFISYFGVNTVVAQQVNFTPRTSALAPSPYRNVQNYNLQGDFVMLGNSNLTFASASSRNDNTSNNQGASMVYNDIDGDSNTINSSSSELRLGSLDPACSEIVYAGLYWSGKADNSNSKTILVSGTTYRKDRVKFKKQGQAYQWVNAGNSLNEIYYPGSSQSGIYVGYADVTDYVRQHGVGNYFVADMALAQGTDSNTGYFGGWGMVIIYKNPSMKWRDITVFDGYAYISSGTQQFDISGFRAAQNGAVNIKMGLMAGEGDRGTSGDYIEIRERTSSNYTTLSHGDNTTNNFFRASIFTGGNNRNPNYINNSGMDISMFDLPNTNNSIINNNQTSTRFRYGTNGDFYSIFNIVFAVDAYVPEVVGENSPGTNNPGTGNTVDPGQNLEFDLDLYNKGTEAVNNLQVDIPIPFNLHYDGASVVQGTHPTIKIPNNTTVEWIKPAWAPVGATPQNYPGGTLRWNVGTLPLDTTMAILQGTLKYRFKATSNCAFLSTAGPCALKINVNGTISGVGATSGVPVSAKLVRNYAAGSCSGAIYNDFESTIAVSQAFIQSCTPPPVEDGMLQFKAFCSLAGNAFPRAQIADRYPLGTKFFTVAPPNYDSNANLVNGNFPVAANGTKTTYYAMVPGMEANCYIRLQTSVELVTTQPTVQNVSVCQGSPVVLQNALSPTGVTNGYQLYYFDSAGATLSSDPNPTAVAAHNYWVAEGTAVSGTLCIGPKVPFTITIHAQPVVAQNVGNISICENNDAQITVNVSGVTTYTWQYTTATAPTVWNTLNNTTYSGQVTVNNAVLNISHATPALNGVKVRLKATNSNNCENLSNHVSIEIKNCGAITNPMLPNKANKQ